MLLQGIAVLLRDIAKLKGVELPSGERDRPDSP